MTYPNKYRQLLDAETWSFIERVESYYPPDAVDLPIDQQRQVYNALCEAFSVARPEAVGTHDFSIAADGRLIPCRRYADASQSRQAAAQILYFHGGGHIVGGLHSHDGYCAEICKATGFNLTAVDYRLAPEHGFPADHEDAQAALQHVASTSDLPIVLLGDSAGANVVAALTHTARWDVAAPVGQVLVYPLLGSDWTQGSFVEHANAPMLTTDDVVYYSNIRLANTSAQVTNKQLTPLNDPDFTGLPPTIVFAAQCDPLRDDGWLYAQKINEAGSDAIFVEEKGLVHSYILARHSVGRARAAVERIGLAVSAIGQGADIADPRSLFT